MNELLVDTSPQPLVTITAMSQLLIKGWDKNQVTVRSADEKLKVDQSDDTVKVHSNDDLIIRVPVGANLQIESAQGETSVKNVSGLVEIEQASSSLTLRNVGPVSANQVGGELHAREVAGDLQIKQVGGFANARDVAGDFVINTVGGHLNLRDASGEISANVGGNANLRIQPANGSDIKVNAGGVLTCRVPADLNASVSLKSSGPISAKVGDMSQTGESEEINLVFGSGAATISLTAQGPLSFTEQNGSSASASFDFDFSGLDNLSDDVFGHVSDQISAQMEMVESQLSGLSGAFSTSGMSKEKLDRINQRAEQKMNRARAKIERAQARAARKIARAERNRNRKSEWNLEFNADSRRPTKTDPVSEEERMMILNMLAEQKITIEQAEELLAALEGES
jgi:hypothetical protein